MEARRRPTERRRTPLGAPPIAPMASTGAVVAREDSNDGAAERGGVGFGIGRGTADRGIAARDLVGTSPR